MKIYTKTGDRGTTSLFGGKRIDKNSARIEAYGSIDELNSLIGTIVAKNPPVDVLKKLIRVQGELFVLGTDLATPADVKIKIPRVTKTFITRLEKEIDLLDKRLPVLKNFILPGGGKVGSNLHLARTVARRAERRIVDLASVEKINQNSLIYINRLSDWLFVLARYINNEENAKEVIWNGRGK
jgi:cob(I)alamin adenosyltransferase